MITAKIIEKLCRIFPIDKMQLTIILSNIHKKGYVNAIDVRALANFGIPIVSLTSKILEIPAQDALRLFMETTDSTTGKTYKPNIMYEDLLIMLSMIVQDLSKEK